MKKLKIALIGENGRMGMKVKEAIIKDDRFSLSYGDDTVMIDFSHESALEKNLKLSIENLWPAVICTTGHDDKNLELIKKASQKIPVLLAPNTSIGANLLAYLVEKSGLVLKDADVSIIDTHHKNKKDAPSGTALMLKKKVPGAQIVSIRAGEAIGEHVVKFFCSNEELELTHRVYDRKVFAQGALKAALFLKEQPLGLYSMADVLVRNCY